jgi:hypothetical protein
MYALDWRSSTDFHSETCLAMNDVGAGESRSHA